jgi:hypothetical protein
MLGDYDGLAIVEFPDNASAAPTSMRASASGAFARFATQTLMAAHRGGRRCAGAVLLTGLARPSQRRVPITTR